MSPDPGRGVFPTDSRWTVRGSADDLPALLRRAADFLDTIATSRAVEGLTVERDGDDVVLGVAFDHWRLPADLDYLDPRLAEGYFGDEPRQDVAFMLGLATELGARTIVDFGCGTGQLAVALAARGHRVIGVDPARAMLDLARTRPGAEPVEWICGDVDALRSHDVDLVVMTGNIPSTHVTDEAWDRALLGLRTALRPGGHLAFGSWNPRARPWERWGWDDVVVLLAADGGAHVGAAGPVPGREVGDHGETLHTPSVWRYRTLEELTASLTRSGFAVDRSYGAWDGSPSASDSPDLVLVAHRA